MDFLNSTRRSIAWIKQQSDNHALELKPPFQRNPVWTDRQKAFLIDTILKGYPVPEIYMQENIDEHGHERHVVVDGQQRIRACLEFMEGRFALHGEDSPDLADMEFDDLSALQKKDFYKYNFITRLMPDTSDEEIRHIFMRLNRNVVALNKQELRHATYWGEFITLMESLADHEYWEGTGIFTANDVRRMLDVEFISELAIAFLHGPQNKKSALDKWYPVYEEGFEKRRTVQNMFNKVLGELDMLLPNIKSVRWRKKSDFYSLFLVLASHHASLPMSSDARKKANKDLEKFGAEVTNYLSGDTSTTKKSVKTYARAVERAASDLKNREARGRILENVLSKYL